MVRGLFLWNDADFSDDMPVEFLQLLRAYPKLLVVVGSHSLDRKTGGVIVIDPKGGNIARILGIGTAAVPLVTDLTGVALVEDRVEYGLLRQPGRIGGEAGGGDQVVFRLTDGTVENHG